MDSDVVHGPASANTSPATGTTPVTPVAVVGMACRLPGGIDSPERLWEALLRADDLITEVPPDRWDADEYYDPEPGVPGRSVCKWGGFLDDIAGFDLDFFGIEEREAIALDPQHRLLLETSWEAMEHAGIPRDDMVESRTGVYVGLTHSDYQFLGAESQAMEGPYGFQGNAFSMASGRIAYALGLHGPALTVDSACSSSLLAVHMACRSLNDGETDLALAGGAFAMLEPRKFVAGSAQNMLSPTGRCRAFDAAADGYVFGEACVMVLLKRLPDALTDGDRILAVIRGTAANQDGHTSNLATPSATAQTAVYRAALAAAGVDARTVGMVEAHGPGAPAGDAIEYASLAEVYGTGGPCALTTAKTNFGHTQSASGALGLMKAVLALQHGAVPEHLHFTRLPDELARISTKLFVPQQTTEWPSSGAHPRRAAVTSYGLSGTNVHAVLEQAPLNSPAAAAPQATSSESSLLFLISSTSPDELRRTAGRLADWVQAHDEVALPDLAYTLARRRGHRPVRTAVVARTPEELAEGLRGVADGDAHFLPAVGGDDRGPVWVFSGPGSQWARMGADLLATEPVFAATVAQIEPLIAQESGFSVAEAMSAAETVSGIDRIHPTLFSMQVALAATMKAYGVHPGAVIGHSVGETAAAVVAGALSLEDGVRVVCRRSRLMSTIAGAGAMASVELPAKQVLSELVSRRVDDVVVSVVASPQSTVIGGAAQAVRELVESWQQRDVMAREIATDLAAHSPEVDAILDELTDSIGEIRPMTPQVPFYSATGFDPREEPLCDAWYWSENLRNTVRFAAAVRAALEDGYLVFAELTPHPLLIDAVKENAHTLDMSVAALASMHRGQELTHGLRGFLSDLHSAGAAVDFSVLYADARLVDAPLPTWTHRRLWLDRDGQEASTAHGGYTVSVHPLLGQHVRLQEEPERHVWQGQVGTAAQPWLGDHLLGDEAVLPGSAYCEMALAAARAVLGEQCEVRDLRFEEALLLAEQTTVGAVATVVSPGVVDFGVTTNERGEHLRHAGAMLHGADDEPPAAHDMAALLAAHPRSEGDAALRGRLDQPDVQYGPAFSGLRAVHIGDDATGTVLAEVALPRQIRSQQGAFVLHPVLLDACLQSVAVHPAVQALGEGALGLPSGIRRLRSYAAARNAEYCYTRVTKADASGIEADLDVLDEHGMVLVSVQGLRLGAGVSEEDSKDRVLAERLFTIEWQQRELPEPENADAGNWLMINTSDTADGLAATLPGALKSHGAQCTTMWWPVDADQPTNSEQLGSQLQAAGFSGVVILTGPRNGDRVDQSPVAGREYVRHFARIVRQFPQNAGESHRVYVVTRNAQSVRADDVVNLEQAGLRGLSRVIAAEHLHLKPIQVDVDEATDVELLAAQLLGGSGEDETAWRGGVWFVARLVRSALRAEERRSAVVDHARDGVRLQLRTPGDLKTLELVACDRAAPGPGQVEVAVSACGVNLAEVRAAADRSRDGAPLGTDFAGVISAVGPGVDAHRVGERVGGLCARGAWAGFVTCEADLVAALPDALSESAAAALTTASATAWYGLQQLARVETGDKVLIFGAPGELAQAALAIARAAGAEVCAAATTEQQRHRWGQCGVEQVYDARSARLAQRIRAATGGGVDLVLNVAAGAAARASVDVLAPGGRFVEVGAGDISADTQLGLAPFRRNLTFYALDLAELADTHPHRVHNVLSAVYRLSADGTLPIPKATHYPLTQAATALAEMSDPEPSGTLVLDIPHAGTTRVTVPPQQARVCRGDGAYIITGGLGERGLLFAAHLAEAGCGRIVLCSRSHPSSDAAAKIEEIGSHGTDVVVECG
ncbi:polyketide synthase, partial [Mycobacterium sp. 852002-51163_SCH5372311]|uniref:sulfolipid-1 biosynthesis phthioceranic/hydroxyphthioceranic acid synthase n=1 Tax=Mycobacterium sp. 852002-51163_SCH5372311 TaxID=1834097 RepID=UPI0007FE031E